MATTSVTPAPLAPYEKDPPIILLGEDDEVFRKLVARTLRAAGYLVLEAPNGERLQSLVHSMLQSGKEPRPELIITDIRMPGMTGLAVLEALRAMDWYTPVILMTAFADRAATDEANRLGAVEVLSKPFNLEALSRRVAEVLPRV